MVKKGVIHKGSGRPRTFIGVIQGVTRDLQAQREAREEQRREDRLCESLRRTDISPRPLSGGDWRDYDYDRNYSSPSRPPPNYSSRPYRSPSPPPRYSSSANPRSGGLQRSATLREDRTRTRTRDFSDRDGPSRLSSVPENRQPHYRDLEVRAIEPGANPRQVQLGHRTTGVSGRSDRRGPPAELRGDYPPEYERMRETARDVRSGRGGYDERESRGGRDRYDERDSYGCYR